MTTNNRYEHLSPIIMDEGQICLWRYEEVGGRKTKVPYQVNGRCGIYRVKSEDELRDGTDMLLSFGGDGSFLSSSHIVARKQIPLLGVNMGRLGFLSENGPGDVADAILNRLYRIEERELLQVSGIEGEFPYALNEISVSRVNAAMLGVNVRLNSEELPTFWADGVLVSTSSGSTAYSLSVGDDDARGGFLLCFCGLDQNAVC